MRAEGECTSRRFIEFFTATIRNRNTRAAYARAVKQFLDWCEKVDFQGSRVISDGVLVLVRELDERLGLNDLVDHHLTDSRRGKNILSPLAGLLRKSTYSRLAGYENVNDVARRAQAFRLVVVADPGCWLGLPTGRVNMQRGAAEFYMPRSVVRAMVEMLRPATTIRLRLNHN